MLVLIALGFIIKNRKKLSFYEKSFLTIALTGVLLSFGPFLHVDRHTIHHPFPIPLPYLLFYYIMPGFQGFRNSQRWEMLFIIAISILVGIILNKIFKNISFKKQFMLYLLLVLGILVEFSPFNFISVPQKKDFPKIYSWMNTTPPDTSFIILPIYNWNMQPYVGQELYREYFSTVEFRSMVNGYSGFSPPPWQSFIGFMHQSFPEEKSIDKLRSLGVNYIIIDKSSFDAEYKAHLSFYNGNMIVSVLKKEHTVLFIKNVDNYSVFKI